MSQRDYVKKKSNKNSKKNSRVIPNLMMAIAIVLLILFIAILYVVSTHKPQPAKKPAKVTEKPEVTLPDKPQERWSYIKELENPNSTTAPLVGEENSSRSAQERQQALDMFRGNNPKPTTVAAANPPATTQPAAPTDSVTKPAQTTTAQRYVVQCGAFKARANAETLKAQIAMTGLNSHIQTGQLARVIVGPYSSKTQAESSLKQLQNNNIKSCIVTTVK